VFANPPQSFVEISVLVSGCPRVIEGDKRIAKEKKNITRLDVGSGLKHLASAILVSGVPFSSLLRIPFRAAYLLKA
jgi:hypothetical protein